MRSSRPDFAKVVSQFEGWRRRRQERRIPEELLDAAVGLLAEHPATAICRGLRLNSSRFKQAREAREGSSKCRRAGGAGRRDRRTKTLRASLTRKRLGSDGGGFVELAPVSWDGGLVRPKATSLPGAATGWQLSLENAAGTVTIILRAPDSGLIDAVRRQLLSALGDGPGA
jgi:hypothetical protein